MHTKPIVTINSNGNGTASIDIHVPKSFLREIEPGRWVLCEYKGNIPIMIKCGDENLRLQAVVKLYCKSQNKKKAILRRLAMNRSTLINRNHGS